MDLKQAQQVARHHLGDQLISIYRGGPYADQWTVHVGSPSVGIPGGLFTAATPDEAAREAASQLRAGGWEPSHARLEWERDGDAIRLLLRIDGWQHPVLSGQLFDNGSGWIGNEQQDIAGYPATAAHIFRQVQRWHDATFRSLYLPPFPGASDA